MNTPVFDTSMWDVTVEEFRARLLAAAREVGSVQPPELREPISLWLRSVEEQSRVEDWKSLLGRPVVLPWWVANVIIKSLDPGLCRGCGNAEDEGDHGPGWCV